MFYNIHDMEKEPNGAEENTVVDEFLPYYIERNNGKGKNVLFFGRKTC